MPTPAGNRYLSLHFVSGTASFLSLNGKILVQSVKIGHKSGYSPADTINNNIKKVSKKFSIKGKQKKIH